MTYLPCVCEAHNQNQGSVGRAVYLNVKVQAVWVPAQSVGWLQVQVADLHPECLADTSSVPHLVTDHYSRVDNAEGQVVVRFPNN